MNLIARSVYYPAGGARSRRPGATFFPQTQLDAPDLQAMPELLILQMGRDMFDELIKKMAREVEKLTHELHVTLPNEIRKAVELGDLKENSEYKSALERQAFVQARLGQLTQRVTKLANIDISQIPTDRVGLGSEVIVEDDATKVKETYRLVFGDAGELVDGHVTMSSPIGRALQGKAPGEMTLLKLPTKVRKLKILSIRTVHEMSEEEVGR
ncbi:MAG: GreA/GreB family elongation factor [Gemmatimonadaceae bacterium]